MKRLLLSALALLGLFAVTFAQEANSDWIIKGNVQTRSELDGTDFSDKTYAPISTSMRTRLSIAKTINNVKLFVQFSDSRLMGDTPGGTLGRGLNIDVHQAYAQMNGLFGMPMDLQVGRFEMKYGTQRFIGPVGWHYVGRTFDGARAKFNFSKSFKLDAFTTLMRIDPDEGYKGNPKSVIDRTGKSSKGSSLSGLWAMINAGKENKLDVFAYYELDRIDAGVNPDGDKVDVLSRTTIGASHWGNYGSLSTITEAAYQLGNTDANDLAAYTASLQIHYNFDDGSIGLGADLMSGTAYDADEGTNNSYATSFGTNHKFYGYMDYFISIDKNTANAGLNDFYLMFKYKLDDNLLFVTNIHQFTTNVETAEGAETAIGQEIDLSLKYTFSPSAKITFGQSVFLPGEWMKSTFNIAAKPILDDDGNPTFENDGTTPAMTTAIAREDMAFWSYIMFQISL
jgi:Alginate export